MADIKQFQGQSQKQGQNQSQRMSQKQIQAVSFLSMPSEDLREEILRMAEENDAIEIVYDPITSSKRDRAGKNSSISADDYKSMLEQREDDRETLQNHLMDQVRMQKISQTEQDLCEKLVYNLDKDGFYGSMMKPETLLDSTQPQQNQFMLKKCIKLIQQLDPVGTCCRDVFESLLVQAQIQKDASVLTLFILDGHLELMDVSSVERIIKNIKDYQKNWHSKAFASDLPIDGLKITEQMVEETLSYIRQLNPRPAVDYISDTSGINRQVADVVLKVEKVNKTIPGDDYSRGMIRIDSNSYFQVKYASGILPEVKLVDQNLLDKEIVAKAKDFIDNLRFMENSFVIQGCSIVKNQLNFFLLGPGNILPLTRKQVAGEVGVHESTVSRFSSKKYSKFIETSWGTFPASYFFSSGVKGEQGEGVSSEAVKAKIMEIITKNPDSHISDSKLTQILNDQGIQIARRTVAKYRNQLGIDNSYFRK